MATLSDVLGSLAAIFPKFARISEASYNLLVAVDPSTTYFLHDKGYIMQNGVRYPSEGPDGSATLSLDDNTRELTLTNADNTTSSITLPIDNYVVSGTLNASTNTITFTFANGGTFDVPIGAVVKIYTGGQTNSTNVSIDSSNKITTDVRVSASSGNTLTVNSDGLFVPTPPSIPIVTSIDSSSTDAQVLSAASLYTIVSAISWQELS